MSGKPGRQRWAMIMVVAFMTAVILLAACESRDNGETAVAGDPPLNTTQQAIAAVLTYQAENPRPTSTRWQGINLAMTAQAQDRFTYETIGLRAGAVQAVGVSWSVLQLTADDEARAFWPDTAVRIITGDV